MLREITERKDLPRCGSLPSEGCDSFQRKPTIPLWRLRGHLSASSQFLHESWATGPGLLQERRGNVPNELSAPCSLSPLHTRHRLSWWPRQEPSQRISPSQWDVLFWAGSESRCLVPAHRQGSAQGREHTAPHAPFLLPFATQGGQRKRVEAEGAQLPSQAISNDQISKHEFHT